VSLLRSSISVSRPRLQQQQQPCHSAALAVPPGSIARSRRASPLLLQFRFSAKSPPPVADVSLRRSCRSASALRSHSGRAAQPRAQCAADQAPPLRRPSAQPSSAAFSSTPTAQPVMHVDEFIDVNGCGNGDGGVCSVSRITISQPISRIRQPSAQPSRPTPLPSLVLVTVSGPQCVSQVHLVPARSLPAAAACQRTWLSAVTAAAEMPSGR
jgi:hypothetical protein